MAFLDNTGLAYFWGKVKTLLNDKVSTKNPSTSGLFSHNGSFYTENGFVAAYNGTKSISILPNGYGDIDATNLIADIETFSTPCSIEMKLDAGLSGLTITPYIPIEEEGPKNLIFGRLKYIDSDEKFQHTPVKLSGVDNGVMPYDAVNVQQLNEAISSAGSAEDKVSKSGDTMTGPLTIAYPPAYITTIGYIYPGGKEEIALPNIVVQTKEDKDSTAPVGFTISPAIKTNPETKKRTLDGIKIGALGWMGVISGSTKLKGVTPGVDPTDAVNVLQLNKKQDKTVLKTITLPASGWSTEDKTQSVSVTGIVEDVTSQVVQVVPAPSSQTSYIEAGVYAVTTLEGTISFAANSVPTSDLTVYLLIQNIT